VTITRKLPAASALAIGVLVLAGCSPFAGLADSDTVTLLTLDGGDDNLALEEIVAAYEEQSDGVDIAITYVPEDTYATKLQTSLLADAPDIAAPYGAETMFEFEPLNDVVFADNGLNIGDYNAVLESFCGIDGQLYCLGTTVGNMGIFYNKAMFDAAGVDYPSTTEAMTFQEFASISAQLTQPGDEATKVWGGGGDTLQAYIDPAHFLDDTGRTVDVLNDGYIGAIETLAGMVTDGSAPTAGETLSVGADQGLQALFLDGRIAMFIGDNYALDAIEETDIDFGLTPVPVVEGDEPWVPVWTNTFGIPVNATHKEEAIDFLTFLATEGQDIQAQYGQMPLLTSVAETWANTDGRMQLVEVSKLARTSVFNPNQWAWNAPLMDAFTLAMDGEPVRPLLEDAQPKAQQANEKTWETFDLAREAAGAE
jgi:multiple sugar transport system substrate-binding protein